MRSLCILLFVVSSLWSTVGEARLELCNRTDLVLMVAVGYDTTDERTVSEGWWKVYPGYCEVPVDVALLKGSYYVHAESNPRSTMPGDAFSWGEEKPLCVKLADFRIPDGNQCAEDMIAIQFNQVDKNWRNSNKIEIFYAERVYETTFETRVAGVQRLLSMLGYEVGEEFGSLNEQTVFALNQVGQTSGVFGFNFDQLFPVLEILIAQKHSLDN